MSTQITLNFGEVDEEIHPTKDHLSKLQPSNASLQAKKDNEWFCDLCRRRVTEGPDGVEYGHEEKSSSNSGRCPIRDKQGMA